MRLLSFALALLSAMAAVNAAQKPSLLGETFRLDLGSPDAMTPGVVGARCVGRAMGAVSNVVNASGSLPAHRTIGEGNSLMVECDLTEWDLSESGVPFVDAVVEVRYRDDCDQRACNGEKRYNCRDNLFSRLERGAVKTVWIGSLGGLNDSAWKSVEVVLFATPFQMIRAIGINRSLVGFQITNNKQPLAPTPLAVSSLTLSFVSKAEAVAGKERINAATTRLERREYLGGALERQPPPPLQEGSAFALFARHYFQNVFPNTVPSVEEASTAPVLRVTEVIGEAEPATLCVFAREDLADVSVEVSGIETVADVVAFEVLHEDRRWGSSYDKYYGRNPWSLRPLVFPLNDTVRARHNWDKAWAGGSVRVPANSTRQLWLTIRVRSNASAGTVSGTVTVCVTPVVGQDSRRQCQAATLELTMLDVALGLPDAETYIYHSPYLKDWWGYDKTYVVKDWQAKGPMLAPVVYSRGKILRNGTVDFTLMREEVEGLMAAGVLNISGRVRLLNNDNWRDVWIWTYANANYFDGRNESQAFDTKMRSVLQQYSELFAGYGLTVDNSFQDEPGNNVAKRKPSTHLNRLAKEVGQTTWVTWYPNCEIPLAGHDFFYVAERYQGVRKPLPSWLTSDPEVRVWFDFATQNGSNTTAVDRSGRANHGTLVGGAKVVNGTLVLPTSSGQAIVADHPSLFLPHQVTAVLGLRVDAINTGYACHPVNKWQGTTAANYVVYHFGESAFGSLGAYATTELSGWRGIPGQNLATRLEAGA